MKNTVDIKENKENLKMQPGVAEDIAEAKPAVAEDDYDRQWDALMKEQQKRKLQSAVDAAGQISKEDKSKTTEEGDEISFGKRLRNLLKQRKMTQKEFADKIGVTQGAVSRYLQWGDDKQRGREPNGQVLKRMAEILNVSTDQFFGTYGESLDDYRQNSVTEIIDAINRNKDFFNEDDKMEIIKSLL